MNAAFGVETPPRPELPECADYAWSLFWKLSAKRRPSESQICPILPPDIESYLRITGEIMDKIDYRFIDAMDSAYISEIAKERKAKMDEMDSNRKSKYRKSK